MAEKIARKTSGKRKSADFKEKEQDAVSAVKKRKVDEIHHVPTLVSSTFDPLEEIDFPRGGAALTPLEKKQAENEGIRDALFEVCFVQLAIIHRRWRKRLKGGQIGEKGIKNMVWKVS